MPAPFRFLTALLCLIAVALPPAPLEAADPPMFVVNSSSHSQAINRARFLPDGKRLVTTSGDKTIRVWDLATGQSTQVIRPPIGEGVAGRILALAVSPDGELVAVAGRGPDGLTGPIFLFDLESGKLVRVLTGHQGFVFGLEFSPGGSHLVSVGEDKTARVWNRYTGRLEATIPHPAIVYGAAFAPNGKSLVTAAFDHNAYVWAFPPAGKAAPEAVLKGHKERVRTVAWSPNGEWIATGSWDKTARLWNPNGQQLHTFANVPLPIYAVRFTPDSSRLVVVPGGKLSVTDRDEPFAVQIFETRTLKLLATTPAVDTACDNVAISPDGKLAAVAGGLDGRMTLWRTADGTQAQVFRPTGEIISSVGWGSDGQSIHWGRPLGSNARSRGPLHRGFRFDRLEFIPESSPNPQMNRDLEAERTNAVRGRSTIQQREVITPVDLRTVKCERPDLPQPQSSLMKLSFIHDAYRSLPALSPDNSRVVLGSEMGGWVYDTRTGAETQKLIGHAGTVLDAAYSPDGKFILTGGTDRTVRIWVPGRDIPLVSLYVEDYEWVAWTPEGYYAASLGGEKLIGWLESRGVDQLPTLHPAERFRATRYRPDVIKLLLRHGSLDGALRVLGENGAGAQKGLLAVVPPTVSFIQPNTREVDTNTGKVILQVSATSKTGAKITGMTVLINGRPAGADAERPFGGGNAVEQAQWVLRVPLGTSRIKVLAETSESTGASEELLVHYTNVNAPNVKPRLLGLVVGISNYQDPQIPKLSKYDTAAEEVSEALRKYGSPEPYSEAQIVTLTNERATRAAILAELKNLAAKATENDSVIVYLAGHGPLNQQVACFCPHDTNLANLNNTALRPEELKDLLRIIPARRLALFLDVQQAGSLLTGLYPLIAEKVGVDLICILKQTAPRGGKPPIFSETVSQGLQGSCPLDEQKRVLLPTLCSYLIDRIKTETKEQQEVHYLPAQVPQPLLLTRIAAPR